MANKVRFRSLSRSSDFSHLKAKGHKIHVTPWLLLNTARTELGIVRCGWTIPRQVGTAVVRNRFKRWGRQYLRSWAKRNQLSFDMNLIFKRRDKEFYKSLRHGEFNEALDKMVAKIGQLGD